MMFIITLLTAFIVLNRVDGSPSCDVFTGYWKPSSENSLLWEPLNCPNFTRPFTNYVKRRKMDHNVRMLFFGDSNDDQTMIDCMSMMDVECTRYPTDSKNLVGCNASHISTLKYHLYSAIPRESAVLNFCVEYRNRPIEQRTYFRNNSEVIEDGWRTFYDLYDAYPNLVGFSVNFWEMVRMREEKSCETGALQEESAHRWDQKLLDDAYLTRWMKEMEISLRYMKLKAEEYNAMLFTRTFQLPLIDKNSGNAVHTNIHSAFFVRQLNAAIRVVAQRLDILLLDVEEMTNWFVQQNEYLRDMVHYKEFISEEVFNILLFWWNEHNARQLHHSGHHAWGGSSGHTTHHPVTTPTSTTRHSRTKRRKH